MNELDSHLEKTSEILKIGSVEKKLQPLKVDNKSQNFLNVKPIRFVFDLLPTLECFYL